MNTPANSSSLIPELWAGEVLENRSDAFVFYNLVNTSYEGDIKDRGDTVHINSIDEFETQALVPGSKLNYKSANVSEQVLLIDQYKHVPYALQEMLKIQSNAELRGEYTKRIGRALARDVDQYLWKIATQDTGKFSNTTAAGAKLTAASVNAALAQLDLANVPQEERALIVDGTGLQDLRDAAEFRFYGNDGNTFLNGTPTNNLVGMLYETIPVYLSNVAYRSGQTHSFVLFHKSAIGCAIQKTVPIRTGFDKDSVSDWFLGSELYGAKVIRPDHGVIITRNA